MLSHLRIPFHRQSSATSDSQDRTPSFSRWPLGDDSAAVAGAAADGVAVVAVAVVAESVAVAAADGVAVVAAAVVAESVAVAAADGGVVVAAGAGAASVVVVGCCPWQGVSFRPISFRQGVFQTG